MNFLRLFDPLLSVLYEDNDIIAIDKPYGFNAHTNDSKIEHSDFIQDGLIEIFEKNRKTKLHIIHRLDQTTTGVMIFGKSAESAKKYAEYFFNRQVEKTYWFITKKKSEKNQFQIDQKIIHKGKELEANTDLQLIRKNHRYELWQALPHTGRNHQIRIHAQFAEISILGDLKYGGDEFLFLCLHNHKIKFPNGITITSKNPIYFDQLDLLDDSVFLQALFQADRRQRLFLKDDDNNKSLRLVHQNYEKQDSGFSIDLYENYLIMNWLKERWSETDLKRFSFFSEILKKPMKVIFLDKTQLLIGDFQNTEIDTLPLNQRLQREWIRSNSKDKSVLNLFSYNSGYAISAINGQAKNLNLVDLNKSKLNSIKDQIQKTKLNEAIKINQNTELSAENVKFFLRDSFTFLEQCINKNIKYDIIVCEIPSFYRREKNLFKIENDLAELMNCLFKCLNLKGEVLILISSNSFYIHDIRKTIEQAAQEAGLDQLEINYILPALDFELPNEKAYLKSFLIRF